jgi:DNA-binding SARP family transcriptional activator
MADILFHLLGPVRVTGRDGTQRRIDGRQPRAVLAVLAMNSNQVVPRARLVDLLWDDPSESAASQVRTHKRRLLDQLQAAGLGDRLGNGTRGEGGYVLDAEPSEVDVTTFLDRLARASAPDLAPAKSAELLASAVELWRGRPGDDLPVTRRLTALCDGLWHRYLLTCEELARLLLGCGRHGEALALLHRHTGQEATREHGWTLLAAAHYRAGDPARAQAVLRRAARIIGEELGLDPGPHLKAAEAAVVRHDREWFDQLLCAPT